MLDLTKSNLVLTAGRQIFFLIIGALILSFGLTSEWPKNNVNSMVQRKFPNPSTPNVFATALNTIANLPKSAMPTTPLSTAPPLSDAQAAANKLKASVVGSNASPTPNKKN